jgi:hypothetical protein
MEDDCRGMVAPQNHAYHGTFIASLAVVIETHLERNVPPYLPSCAGKSDKRVLDQSASGLHYG